MNFDIQKYWNNKKDKIFWFRNTNSLNHKPEKKNIFFNDCTTNVAYNCIEYNIKKNLGKKKAIIFLDKNLNSYDLNYNNLESLTNYFIFELDKFFKKKKIKKVSTIAIHSSANLCSVISMLSCAKMGIRHGVIFDDLPIEAIISRLKLLKTNLLITSTDDETYNEKIIYIKKKLKIDVIRFERDENKLNKFNFINFLNNKNFQKKFNYKKIKSNHPLFVLFTSGSTGVPKGVEHGSGGYLLYSKITCQKQFGIDKKSIILTASDAGWINGHTYALYGPLSLGATTVILEKPIDIINKKVLRKILLDFKISILYMPVTLIRILKGIYSEKLYSKYLKVLGSMGEPLSYHVAKWFGLIFSKKYLPIINTYFQTETGGIVASTTFKKKQPLSAYGTVGKPLDKSLGIFIDKINNEIKIQNSWPGRMINIINEKKVWKKYFDKKNNFRLFDFACYDKNKNIVINGRVDDVINIRGHRVGSGEVESVILKSIKIKEACCIAVEDYLEGFKLVVFVSVNQKIAKLEIENIICEHFGSFLRPKNIFILPELLKTKSGKILRRVLRDLYYNPSSLNIGDLTTVGNAKLIDQIRKIILNEKNN